MSIYHQHTSCWLLSHQVKTQLREKTILIKQKFNFPLMSPASGSECFFFPLNYITKQAWCINFAIFPQSRTIFHTYESYDADGTSCSGWPFLFLSIILRASETCLPTTNMKAFPFPPAPLAVLPTRRTYSLGSRGKSKSTTWSTPPSKSIPLDALQQKQVSIYNRMRNNNKVYTHNTKHSSRSIIQSNKRDWTLKKGTFTYPCKLKTEIGLPVGSCRTPPYLLTVILVPKQHEMERLSYGSLFYQVGSTNSQPFCRSQSALSKCQHKFRVAITKDEREVLKTFSVYSVHNYLVTKDYRFCHCTSLNKSHKRRFLIGECCLWSLFCSIISTAIYKNLMKKNCS